MWIVAIVGSVSAFVESTPAQLYKVEDSDTKFRGGPAYYMRDGLKLPKMGTAFALLLTLSFGLIFNAGQANTITSAFATALNITKTNAPIFNATIGVFLVVLSGYIILGGRKKLLTSLVRWFRLWRFYI